MLLVITMLIILSIPLSLFMYRTIKIKQYEDSIRQITSKLLPKAQILSRSILWSGTTYRVDLTIMISKDTPTSLIKQYQRKIHVLFEEEPTSIHLSTVQSTHYDSDGL